MAMNMNAALTISAKVDGANNIIALNRGLQTVEGTAKGVTGALKGLTGASAGLSGALGMLGPLLSVAGLVGLAKGALEAGDSMNDLSMRTGVSVESLARFKKAAALSGTDIEGVSKSLVKLSKAMLEANTGNDQSAAAFKALGVSITDSSGKLRKSDDVMLQVANRFADMPDGVEKTALAVKLFGKAGAEMIPMLNMGGDAIDKLSSKMTTAFAQKADEYNDKLAMLGGKISSLGQDIFLALLPALTAVTDAVSGAVEGFNKLPGPVKATALAGALLAISWGPIAGVVRGTQAALTLAAGALEYVRYQAALAGGVVPMLTGLFSELWVAITGPVGLVAAGLALVGVAAYNLSPPFKAFIDEFPQRFSAFADELGQQFGDAFTSMTKGWNDFTTSVSRQVAPLGKVLQDLATWIANTFSIKFDQIKIDWRTTVADIINWTNPLAIALNKISGGKINIGKAAVDTLFSPAATRPGGTAPAGAPGAAGFTPDMAALQKAGAADSAAARATADRERLKIDLQATQNQFAYINKQREINELILKENDYRNKGLTYKASEVHLQMIGKQEKLEELRIDDDLLKKLGEAAKEMDPQNRALKEQIANTEAILKKADLRVKLEQDQRMEIQATTRAIEQQRREQDKALQNIANEPRYARIGAFQGSQMEQRARQMDALKQQQEDAKDDPAKVQAIQAQIDALKKSWAEMDAMANNAAFGFKKGITAYLEGIGSLADSVANVAKNVLQGLEDKLVDFVMTGKANFQEFANYAIQQLMRIVIQQTIMKPIANFISTLIPTPSANGNVFTANGIQPFAMGGIVDRPMLFPFAKGIGLMGEAGPEAIMPLRRGADGKLGVAAAGGGGGTIVNVSVDAKGTNVQGNNDRGSQLGRVIAQAVQAELVKQRRPGGLLTA